MQRSPFNIFIIFGKFLLESVQASLPVKNRALFSNTPENNSFSTLFLSIHAGNQYFFLFLPLPTILILTTPSFSKGGINAVRLFALTFFPKPSFNKSVSFCEESTVSNSPSFNNLQTLEAKLPCRVRDADTS